MDRIVRLDNETILMLRQGCDTIVIALERLAKERNVEYDLLINAIDALDRAIRQI